MGRDEQRAAVVAGPGRRGDPAPLSIPPLVPPALALTAGVAIDRLADPCGTAAWMGAAAGLGLLSALALLLRLRQAGAAALVLAWLALGGGWHHGRWSDLAADDLARVVAEGSAPGPVWVRGAVAEVEGFRPGERPDDPGLTRALVDVAEVADGSDWRAASGRIQVTIRGDRSNLAPGAWVSAAGKLAAIAGPRNPGEFSYRDRLRARGIRLRLDVDGPAGIWEEPGRDAHGTVRGFPAWRLAWYDALGRARAWSLATLARGLESYPEALPLASALLLGRREAIEPEVNDAFARTGTTHLLAISGLHLQVLAWFLGRSLLAAGMGRRPASLTVAAAALGYAALVGLVPSVVRSVAMTLAGCWSSSRDRRPSPANTLALAAIATLLLNPTWLFDAGCQLSFLAVAAIVWGVPPALALLSREVDPLDRVERQYEARWRSWLRRPVEALWVGLVVSTVVWLAALPLVVSTFHVVAPVGVPLNVPLVPIASAALLASGATLGLAAACPPLGEAAGRACGVLLSASEWLVRRGAGWRWGHWFEPGPPVAAVVAFYAALALVLVAPGPRSRRAAWGLLGIVTLVGLHASITPRSPGATEAEVLAVDHGLAVIVQAADGRAMLYDCGRMADPRVGRRLIAPALWARGVRRLDAVVLSHADFDHYSGLPDLLDRFAIDAVLVPEGFESPANPDAGPLLEQARSRGVAVRTVTAGECWGWQESGVRFAVLHPPEGWGAEASDNARSLVVAVDSAGARLLLTGDLDGEGLLAAEAFADPPVAAMLAPHHGGRTANPAWLYDTLGPSLVVASQRTPPAGSSDALAALTDRGIRVLRTWQEGAVRLRWEGGRIVAPDAPAR